MSSFTVQAKHRASGKTHEVLAMDDYFGKHRYGYIPNVEGGTALTEEQFHLQYEMEEAA